MSKFTGSVAALINSLCGGGIKSLKGGPAVNFPSHLFTE